MEQLPFEKIKKGMDILIKRGDTGPFHKTTVVETSLGHPSKPTVRILGGFNMPYGQNNWFIYPDNKVTRTEILLGQEQIYTE